MTNADKALIREALLSYAEMTEKSPMRFYTQESTSQQVARCHELARYFETDFQSSEVPG